jgi:Xaa-Pro aminopeptidase
VREFDCEGPIGIETWDRFPLQLYIDLKGALPQLEFAPSTVVEELRLVKTPYEVEVMRRGGAVGDLGHEAFTAALRRGVGKSEVDLIRVAESAMREADPIYEDACMISPSKICSGTWVNNCLLHAPQSDKTISRGDIVNWDICMRYNGYSVDVSRTRVIGRPDSEIQRAYDTSLVMFDEVLKAAKPGLPAARLVGVAQSVAREAGFALWGDFLGHATGLDCQERPVLTVEETPLAENMVLAIEPRIQVGDRYLLASEDEVLVTPAGGVSFSRFPKAPLELG